MLVELGKYKNLSEKDISEILMKEGFKRVYVWEDYPGSYYPEHSHEFYSAHIVLEGEIKIKTSEGEFVFRKGDRFDVEKGEIHSAKIGPKGCRYIVGEK